MWVFINRIEKLSFWESAFKIHNVVGTPKVNRRWCRSEKFFVLRWATWTPSVQGFGTKEGRKEEELMMVLNYDKSKQSCLEPKMDVILQQGKNLR